MSSHKNKKIIRVQTGVRLEKRLLKILKAVAAHKEIGLGNLIEGVLLHNFEGKTPFSTDTLEFINQMKTAYKFDLSAADSHKLFEEEA